MSSAAELVTLKTRVDKVTMRRLVKVAARNERSVAAELRVIVDRHLRAELDEVKP